MFDAGEGAQGLANALGGYPGRKRRDRRGHRVVNIVYPFYLQLIHADRQLLAVHPHTDRVSVETRRTTFRAFHAEGQHLHVPIVPAEVFERQRIVRAIDELIGRSLVLKDAKLAVHVILQLVIVAVEVVGRNVHQHPHVGPEIVHAVELETAQLNHVPVKILGGHLQREALPNVARKAHAQVGLPQHFVSECGGGRLAVAAGDANRARTVRVAPGEFDLRDYRNPALTQRLHNRSALRNAGAFDHLVGIENQLFGMASLFIRHAPLFELSPVFRGDRPPVRQEHVEPLDLSQHGRAAAAFAPSEHYNPSHRYLILSVASVMAANNSCTIQKRTTIFDSK